MNLLGKWKYKIHNMTNLQYDKLSYYKFRIYTYPLQNFKYVTYPKHENVFKISIWHLSETWKLKTCSCPIYAFHDLTCQHKYLKSGCRIMPLQDKNKFSWSKCETCLMYICILLVALSITFCIVLPRKK